MENYNKNNAGRMQTGQNTNRPVKEPVTNENYVDRAEEVIKELSSRTNSKNGKKEPMVTTSKIRNLLALTNDIYNDVMNEQSEELNEEICSRIEYLRVRFLYEAGREPKVKDLVLSADILDVLKNVKKKRSNYILFNRYMEALVAFHKYYGGKDN